MLPFNKEKEKGTTRGRDLSLSCGPKNSVKCMTWGTNPEKNKSPSSNIMFYEIFLPKSMIYKRTRKGLEHISRYFFRGSIGQCGRDERLHN